LAQGISKAPVIPIELLKNCARCGGEHADIEFVLLTNPERCRYTHWAMCPVAEQPILLRIAEEVADES